jgi:hypothetical protein
MMDSAIEAVEHSAFDHPLSLALDDSTMVDVPKEKMTTVHHYKEEFSDEFLFKNRDFDTSQQTTSHHHHHSNGKAGLVEEVEDELFGGKRKSGASDVFGASTFEVTEAPVKKKVEPPAVTVIVAAVPSAPKTEEPAPHEEVEDDGEQQVKAMVEFESFPPPMSERQAKRAASQRKSSNPRKSASNSNGFSFGLPSLTSSSSSSSSSSSTSTSSSRSEGSEERDQVYDISIPITHIEESPNDEESYAVRTHHLFYFIYLFVLLFIIYHFIYLFICVYRCTTSSSSACRPRNRRRW